MFYGRVGMAIEKCILERGNGRHTEKGKPIRLVEISSVY